MDLVHRCLEELLAIPAHSRVKLAFVSLGHPGSHLVRFLQRIPISAIRQLIYQNCLHLRLVWRALRTPPCDVVVIMEFNPPHMLLASPLLKLSGRRLAFFLHGSQQLATTSRWHRAALSYFKLFGFGTIQLEVGDEMLPPSARVNPRRNLIIPIPATCAAPAPDPPERRGSRLRVGVVGMFRPGKPVAELAAALARAVAAHPDDFELILGTPAWQDDERLASPGCEIVDTSKHEDYVQLLQSLDIAAYHFEERSYYYRASGTIADAASAGCHILCPDFPVIRHEVMWPARVGTCFASLDDLPRALADASEFVRTHGRTPNREWQTARGAPALAELFDQHFLADVKPVTAAAFAND